MLDKLKNNKFLWWLVPVILLIPAAINFIMKVLSFKANKDLQKAQDQEKKHKAVQEELLNNAKASKEKADEISKTIDKLKVSDDWHKTFKRKK